VARKTRRTINRCKYCGSFLNSSARVSKIISDADESLERFYNKMRKKK
tara:strand:+ start:510 stop:653 length:144 start_codon:yes stop_codon:yes gene_type:complete